MTAVRLDGGRPPGGLKMPASRKVRIPSKAGKRRASTSRQTPSRPRVKRLALQAAPVAPQEEPSVSVIEHQQPVAEPILLLGNHLSGPEVLVINSEGSLPHSPAAAQRSAPSFRPLAWGVSIALMTATIVGGLQFGHSLKSRVSQIRVQENLARQSAEESQREMGLAESAPPRRGVEWTPSLPPSRVDRPSPAGSREPAPQVAAPRSAEEGRPWARLTALMRDGIRLHHEGWYGPATARFREAVAVMPDHLRAYLWLGRAGLKAGRYDEARRALEQVIALDPQSAAAQEAKALLSQIDKDN
jgi:hypothetical protein